MILSLDTTQGLQFSTNLKLHLKLKNNKLFSG